MRSICAPLLRLKGQSCGRASSVCYSAPLTQAGAAASTSTALPALRHLIAADVQSDGFFYQRSQRRVLRLIRIRLCPLVLRETRDRNAARMDEVYLYRRPSWRFDRLPGVFILELGWADGGQFSAGTTRAGRAKLPSHDVADFYGNCRFEFCRDAEGEG